MPFSPGAFIIIIIHTGRDKVANKHVKRAGEKEKYNIRGGACLEELVEIKRYITL